MRSGVKSFWGMSLVLLAWLIARPGFANVEITVESSAEAEVSSEERDKTDSTNVPPREQTGEIVPMSDPAIQGTACLGFATLSMATAYAMGPAELLMLASGAMHVPTSSSVLFVPLFSILGVGSCALAATATPSVRWLISQSDEIAGQAAAWFNFGQNPDDGSQIPTEDQTVKPDTGRRPVSPPPVRPMNEPEIQSTGCVVGAASAFGASMATSPMEVAMLSSGATIIVSSAPMLGMGLLATIVASGCGIGSFAAVPIVAFVNNFNTIGDVVLNTLGQGAAWIFGGSSGDATRVLESDHSPVKMAGSGSVAR